jgi:uncharacterized protein
MKQVFINLPVVDVEKSMKFYQQLGFQVNPLFTDEHQKCLVWSESIYVMLISVRQFERWNPKTFSAINFTTANFTLPVESQNQLNLLVEKGLKAGGTEPSPMIDEGYMHLRRIQDLDGHVWGIICLDLDKFRKTKKSH